ncbi:hypothetical protein BSQ49_08590 [Liquorilactobacillus hordei]|uniref:Uncharacterized protein n=1 Tax=Liquorilactobacillus hordei TaxID=468911 RepID=A0A3S6QQ87_9LACO|nr:hypothetical protein BSQ49_08590 [Liquorilactobacillus hordei]MBZ2406720.1 hypothetical protein [Liquorilactobacillus hordei]
MVNSKQLKLSFFLGAILCMLKVIISLLGHYNDTLQIFNVGFMLIQTKYWFVPFLLIALFYIFVSFLFYLIFRLINLGVRFFLN